MTAGKILPLKEDRLGIRRWYRAALSMRSISGYGNLPTLHGNAEYPEFTLCKLVFIAIVYTRSRCVGNLLRRGIDSFNLIPRNIFPDNADARVKAVSCKKTTTIYTLIHVPLIWPFLSSIFNAPGLRQLHTGCFRIINKVTSDQKVSIY